MVQAPNSLLGTLAFGISSFQGRFKQVSIDLNCLFDLITRQAYNLSLSTSLHGSIMSNEKAIVYAEDMTDEMMNEAIKTAKNAFQSSSNRVSGGPYKETAAQIRGHFDKQYGPHWNCIVGRSFGSYVTHEIKTYIYFSVKAHVAVLLWKT